LKEEFLDRIYRIKRVESRELRKDHPQIDTDSHRFFEEDCNGDESGLRFSRKSHDSLPDERPREGFENRKWERNKNSPPIC